MSQNTQVNISFPVFQLLTLLFIGLKLTGNITWSWLWVLSPFWIPFSIIFVFYMIVGIISASK